VGSKPRGKARSWHSGLTGESAMRGYVQEWDAAMRNEGLHKTNRSAGGRPLHAPIAVPRSASSPGNSSRSRLDVNRDTQ